MEKIVGVKPLPRKLLFQMDNCVKDNKNHHLPAKFLKKFNRGFLLLGTHMKILMEVLDICRRN